MNFLDLWVLLTKIPCCCVGTAIDHFTDTVLEAEFADFLNVVISCSSARISEEEDFLPLLEKPTDDFERAIYDLRT